MRRARGATLIELMLGIALLGMLLTLLFLIFHMGWNAWRSANLRSDLNDQSRLVVQSLSRDLEASVYASLSLQGEAVSFLSARDDAGVFALDGNGDPLWQRYVVFYRDAGRDEVVRAELPLAAPLSAPEPIEVNTGQPLASLLGPGRVIARGVKRLALSVPLNGRRLRMEVDVEQPQRGGLPPARMTLSSAVHLRND